jgi:hypothetical protein
MTALPVYAPWIDDPDAPGNSAPCPPLRRWQLRPELQRCSRVGRSEQLLAKRVGRWPLTTFNTSKRNARVRKKIGAPSLGPVAGASFGDALADWTTFARSATKLFPRVADRRGVVGSDEFIFRFFGILQSA